MVLEEANIRRSTVCCDSLTPEEAPSTCPAFEVNWRSGEGFSWLAGISLELSPFPLLVSGATMTSVEDGPSSAAVGADEQGVLLYL